MKLIFDTETNGLKDCSVLSFSAILLDENNNIVEEVDRYYYPTEPFNDQATTINGLTKQVIADKREGVKYPLYFSQDEEILELFDRADELIAHNINFDIKFIDRDLRLKKMFCTMAKSTDIVCIPNKHIGDPDHPSYGQKHKWPKLIEAVEFFEIDVKKIREELQADFHSSLFDVYCTREIYKKLKDQK